MDKARTDPVKEDEHAHGREAQQGHPLENLRQVSHRLPAGTSEVCTQCDTQGRRVSSVVKWGLETIAYDATLTASPSLDL